MSLIRSITQWRPRTRFYYGWLVLGVASLGTFGATGVAQVVLGGIQDLIFVDMGWERSTIAYAVTAGTWMAGAVSPFVGRLADRHGPRGLMPAATILTGLCLFALSGIQAVWHFYAAYIIARGLGNPILISVVPRTLSVNFFQRKRNFAMGLTGMARPVSGSINIQLFSLIAQSHSWRVAYWLLGAFSLLLAVPLWLILRRRPEDIGLQPDGDNRAPSAEHLPPKAGATRQRPPGDREFGWSAGEAALTFTFWAIVSAECFSIMISGALGYQVVPYLLDSGVSRPQAALALSISSMMGALANPAWGFLSDRYSPRLMAIAVLLLACAATMLFLAIDAQRQGFLVVVIWGTASGGVGILGSMMLAQYFGRASFGSIIGTVGLFQTVALGLGPSLGAVLFQLTAGYTSLFLFGVAAYTIAILLIYAARRPRLPRRAIAEGHPAES